MLFVVVLVAENSLILCYFQVLEKVTEWPNEDRYRGGLNEVNRNKNRYQDILASKCITIMRLSSIIVKSIYHYHLESFDLQKCHCNF